MSDSEATLATQVYRRLRTDLLEGRLAPGAKLKVQNIAADYGVGASPIREALSSLAAEGLVERLDQRGFRAAPIALAEFDELVRSRCWVEEIVLRESISAGDAEWEEALVLATYRLVRLARTGATEAAGEWQEALKAYHAALLSACPAPTLLAFCNTLRERAVRYANIARSLAVPPRDTLAEHQAVTDAALSRNADEACRRLVEHHTNTAAHLRPAFARMEQASGAKTSAPAAARLARG